MDELQANKNQLVTIAYCMPILASVVFVIFVAVFVGTAFCSYRESIQKSKVEGSTKLFSNKWRSAIVAVAVISAVNIFYALGASCYACAAIKDQPDLTFESTLLSNVSIMVAIADGILLLLCILTDILALFAAINHSPDCAYIILGCTSFYSLLCILQHCPYIILAYINDVELTGSIFIFYTVSWSLIFLALSRFYTIYQELILPYCNNLKIFNDNVKISERLELEASGSSSTSDFDQHRTVIYSNTTVENNVDPEASLTSTTSEASAANQRQDLYEDLDRQGSRRSSLSLLHRNQPTQVHSTSAKSRYRSHKLFCKSFLFVLCSLVICILIIGAVGLLTCYLIILPITNGLSHLFGRLIDTYHTALVIVGAFLAYKTLIEKKNDSQTVQQPAEGQNNQNQVPTVTSYGTDGQTENSTRV
jgi:hypothetical protein